MPRIWVLETTAYNSTHKSLEQLQAAVTGSQTERRAMKGHKKSHHVSHGSFACVTIPHAWQPLIARR